jgi:5,10-methylenetetrahydrofolate reductase
MGVRAIACLNSRDRNRLGFRRDLLTAAAYGVDEFLCVYGDEPASGRRSSDLTVRSMLEEVRTFGASQVFAGVGPFTVGVTSRLAPFPAWKQEADFLFVQASFDVEALLRWREGVSFSGKVFAGVIVVASATMARNLSAKNLSAKNLSDGTAQIQVPSSLLSALEADGDAGIDHACRMMAQLRTSGAFDGAHLVPVGRYRAVAARLEDEGWRRSAAGRANRSRVEFT